MKHPTPDEFENLVIATRPDYDFHTVTIAYTNLYADFQAAQAEIERLKGEVDKLLEIVASNICGYCLNHQGDDCPHKARIQRLEKAGDAMAESVKSDHGDCDCFVQKTLDEWRKAKEQQG